MKNEKQVLYFYMILVTIGTVLIALTTLRYMSNVNDSSGYLILFGLIFTISYINYLEKKAGISKKVIWIRNSVYTVLVISLTYFLYF
ncbi:hypothetical protein P9D39_14535 [Heyndrickxia oleronia]|uniref:Uncharacterized protein n=1 Tax=Heyndrickxia oleronia TaxID=38875 RepID=A0A8E2I2N3_9BACI|nr:hypothetical protein [Heyndrickxia oleronia]MEC1375517.1 hypothetical protein [Heyndrickxia oleronia]NYV64107.1 hypothetical protein [Bacillus sp. Gen3]OOP64709.1 hypothetical protein BWZ43_25280 [Heyndrickxia oleronia]QQZ04029.1 hypothetical protein I5818_20370 [Heyndrickxia oleronia]